MVLDIKKRIETGKVLFGIKQTLKNIKNVEKVYVPTDCREEILKMLYNNKLEVKKTEFSKTDMASKLELDFQCEVFAFRK